MNPLESNVGDIPVESAPLEQGPGSASSVRLKRAPTPPFLLAFLPGRWRVVTIDGQAVQIPDLVMQVIRPGVNGIRQNPNNSKGPPDYGPWRLAIERKGGIVLDRPELVEQYRFRARGFRSGVEVNTYFLVGFAPKRIGNEVVIRKVDDSYDRFCQSLCGDERYGIPAGPDQELVKAQVAKVEQSIDKFKGAPSNAASDRLIAHTEERLDQLKASLDETSTRAKAAEDELQATKAESQAQATALAERDAELEELRAQLAASQQANNQLKKEATAAKSAATKSANQLKKLQEGAAPAETPTDPEPKASGKRQKPTKKE